MILKDERLSIIELGRPERIITKEHNSLAVSMLESNNRCRAPALNEVSLRFDERNSRSSTRVPSTISVSDIGFGRRAGTRRRAFRRSFGRRPGYLGGARNWVPGRGARLMPSL